MMYSLPKLPPVLDEDDRAAPSRRRDVPWVAPLVVGILLILAIFLSMLGR
jgi:hypothetical protein